MMGGAMNTIERQPCRFFLLRYAPDAVKNEFVNVGLVLLPAAGSAEVRFTRDWSRVRCLDPQADVEWLEAMETDLRGQLLEMNGDRDFILRKIQDSFSNALQPSEFKACLAESPGAEADELARLYLERSRRRQPREVGARQTIYHRMREEFENAGLWGLMRRDIRAADFTRSGDPLKIDCGYLANGTVKMFHALPLLGDVNAAKVLAFSFPRLVEGIRKTEGARTELTAVVEDDLEANDENEETIGFARETLEQQSIRIAPLRHMPVLAATAARELGLM
jgi:hypothetical protein